MSQMKISASEAIIQTHNDQYMMEGAQGYPAT